MATLAETLGAQANPTVDVAESLSSGVKAGIQLATAAEDVQKKKSETLEKKMELATKQATSMMNRTKAAMFAQSDAAFKSIMDSNKSYANSINLPYNDEALRAAYKDPSLRLAAQKEINTVLTGGVSKNPQAIIDFFGSESPAIFEHLQNSSYANAQKQQGFDQQTKIEKMGNDSAERIAAMGMDKIDKREDMVLAKEKRAEAKQLDNDFASTDKLLNDLKETKKALAEYSKNSTGGTGAFSTAGGLTKFASQKTEELDSKFNNISLDSMVKMFSGMSKAVDTNAERRIFESTQSSITLDDKTNMEILDKKIAAAEAMKKKILDAKKGIGAIEASGALAGGSAPNLDLQSKIEKAKKAGYTEAQINDYLKGITPQNASN